MDEILAELALSRDAQYKAPEPGSDFHRIVCLPDVLVPILEVLLRDSRFWCDHLISITGLHRTSPSELLELHYHLASFPTGIQVHVMVSKPVPNPGEMVDFQSITHLWKSADWHERETGELFGIRFLGHPDQRNLLLPANWQGFPLRKDYQVQETYHGIKVKYQAG